MQRAMLDDDATFVKLSIFLAAAIDAGEPFVRACYFLEGVGLTPIVVAYKMIKTIQLSRDVILPNLSAVARDLAGDDVVTGMPDAARVMQLYFMGEEAVKAAHVYMDTHYFNNGAPLVRNLLRYEAAQMMDPGFVVDIGVDELQRLTGLLVGFKKIASLNLVPELLKELPAYRALVIGIDPRVNKRRWWRARNAKREIPAWVRAARVVFCYSPSSASSERIFSRLQAAFTAQQQRSLSDLVETTLMRQVNANQPLADESDSD
jgi:hypothetical protein